MKKTAPPLPIHKKPNHKKTVIVLIAFSLLMFVVGVFLFKVFFSHEDLLVNKIITCDVNSDSLCDFHDIETFNNAMGSCNGDFLYREEFDTNGDGCLTEGKDLKILIKQYYDLLENDRIPTPIVTPYAPSCDHDKDYDCDVYDTFRVSDIDREKDLVRKLQGVIENYHTDYETYPDSLNQLIPEYMAEIPSIRQLHYQQVKGGLEYSICYLSLETEPPERLCIENED